MPTTRLLTIGEIAKLERIPAHRISYAIEQYHVEPVQRAGIIRLYDEPGIAAIRSALRRIGRERGGRT